MHCSSLPHASLISALALPIKSLTKAGKKFGSGSGSGDTNRDSDTLGTFPRKTNGFYHKYVQWYLIIQYEISTYRIEKTTW